MVTVVADQIGIDTAMDKDNHESYRGINQNLFKLLFKF